MTDHLTTQAPLHVRADPKTFRIRQAPLFFCSPFRLQKFPASSFFPSLHFSFPLSLAMSFQQFPTEVKQLIVDEAAKSDQTFQSLGKKEGKKLTARPSRGPLGGFGRPVEPDVFRKRGRAVSALSLTSRELRALSVKYLFEVSCTFPPLRHLLS